jgi:hypothetical protein
MYLYFPYCVQTSLTSSLVTEGFSCQVKRSEPEADYLPLFSFKYTNKMQRYTTFFITVNSLHVSGGFSAHHRELKNCTHSIWYISNLLAATASGSSKQAWHILVEN